MPVHNIHHLNICSPPAMIEELREFYTNVIGLTEGWRPDVPVAGHWLYIDDKPVIHLMESNTLESKDDIPEAGVLDHFAFSCTNLNQMENHLTSMGQHYTRTDISSAKIIQLVITDPIGINVELNFDY